MLAIIAVTYPIAASIIKFVTKGKDPIKAGMAVVTDLLEKGVHPDDIILMGNSLGGGIAAEVLKKFEEENIFFTFIHSNSYDSLVNASKSQRFPITDKWLKRYGFDYKPNKIIESTKAPVLSTNRIGDMVIGREAQSVTDFFWGSSGSEIVEGYKMLASLSHCRNIKECKLQHNPHVDKLTHMYALSFNQSELKGNFFNYCGHENKTYEKLLEDFIGKAHEYLEENKLNSEFKLNTFQHSKLYQEIKKNAVLLIDRPSSKLITNDESLEIASSRLHNKA